MKRVVIAAIVLFAGSLGACSAPKPTQPDLATPSATSTDVSAPVTFGVTASPPVLSPTPTDSQPRSGTLRTITSNPLGLRHVPYMMALDVLRQEGYTIQTTSYATIDLAGAALVNGDVDLAYFSDQLAWAASAKSAPVRTIMDFNGDPYLIAAKGDIKSCGDLQNKTLAFSSNSTVYAVMLDEYMKQRCPGPKPQVVLIPSSSARLAALISGQIDSAILETDDALQLDRQAPGRFNILRRFADEFPTIELGGYHVRTDFASKNPVIIKDFVTALVQAHRRVQDKQVLLAGVKKYLNNDTTALAAVDTYLAQNAWDVNGGLTTQRVQDTLDFLIRAKMLPPDLPANQVADLSYLDAVIRELGRK